MKLLRNSLVALALGACCVAAVAAVVSKSITETRPQSPASGGHPVCFTPVVGSHGDDVTSTARLQLGRVLVDPQTGANVRPLTYWITWTRDRRLLGQSMGGVLVDSSDMAPIANKSGGIDPTLALGPQAPQGAVHGYEFSIAPNRIWGEVDAADQIRVDITRTE
jgi:hypothetical protein